MSRPACAGPVLLLATAPALPCGTREQTFTGRKWKLGGEAELEDAAPAWAACDGPTGIAHDAASKRLFSGCGGTSVVSDPVTHTACRVQPGYGPHPAGMPAPEPGRPAPRGPIVAGWFVAVTH